MPSRRRAQLLEEQIVHEAEMQGFSDPIDWMCERILDGWVQTDFAEALRCSTWLFNLWVRDEKWPERIDAWRKAMALRAEIRAEAAAQQLADASVEDVRTYNSAQIHLLKIKAKQAAEHAGFHSEQYRKRSGTDVNINLHASEKHLEALKKYGSLATGEEPRQLPAATEAEPEEADYEILEETG